jgi:hypothetical protein
MHGIEVFHYFHEFAFFITIAGLLLVASEIAYFCGKRAIKKLKPELASSAENVSSALLGLLALLMGFAFAMSLNRFETRKNLLREEVTNIQVAYRNADFLWPHDATVEAKKMFADYTGLRTQYYQKGTLAADMQNILNETVSLQNKLWAWSIQKLNHNPEKMPHVSTFVNSLNPVFTDYTKRTEARNDHIPEAILWLLLTVAIIAISTKTYSLGLKGAHLLLPRMFMILAISSVMVIILDLDRPIRGIIQIDQHEMTDLREVIVKDLQKSKK